MKIISQRLIFVIASTDISAHAGPITA